MAILGKASHCRGHVPRHCLFLFALAAISLSPEVCGQIAGPGAPSREYQVKAVFLFNFARFVDWPPGSFDGAAAPLVIGVLGDDPFGPFLDEAVRGETVGGRPIVIRRCQTAEDSQGCQILYISQSESDRLGQILGLLKGRSILTVSDVDSFSAQGGVIRFLTDNKHIKLRINLDAAKAADLKISSKLLRPAQIVTNGKD